MSLHSKTLVLNLMNKIERSFLAFLSLPVIISIIGVYITRDYFMDDALITLRYSYNFARYFIPIWNQADMKSPSMGYTSFLWMIVNAIPALFTQNKDILVFMAQIFSFVALIVIVVVICWKVFTLPISTSYKFLAVCLIFSQVGYGLHVNSAMETMLFSCVVLLTIKTYAEGHYRQAYLFAAISFLVRPEGAILTGLLILWDLIDRRFKQAFSGAFVFSILVAGTVSLLYYWYGDMFPNTFYAKQEVLNISALTRTAFFIVTLALPFLIMSIFSMLSLKNKMSYFMFCSAAIYIAYYVTVDPIMNVLSRYQWPCLVLLTYSSIPTLEFLCNNLKKYKLLVVSLILLFVVTNVGNGLGASYFASATGHGMKNLVVIGKRMAYYRDSEKWLVFHDAGTIVYYSDWNTHETIGLTNRQLTKGQVRLTDIYSDPNSQIVMRNFDQGEEADKLEYTRYLFAYGYHYVQDLPILVVPGQRNFVIAVYARDLSSANVIFRDLDLNPPIQPNISYILYRIAKDIVKGVGQ